MSELSTSVMSNRVLDALDNAPIGSVTGEGLSFVGSLASIQMISAEVGCSDTSTLRAVHELHDQGLVQIFDARDPEINRRRLLVTGEAV